MADGFTLEIDEDLAWTLEKRAAEVGMSREAYARRVLHQNTFDPDDYTWLNGDPRTTGEDADQDDPGTPWEEVKVRLLKRLETKLAERN